MASTFSVFRKNRKLMFAALTLLAMISFVFLPIILQNMGNRSVANPVAVKTSLYGNLTERDLAYLVQQQQRVFAVLSELSQMAEIKPSMIHQWLQMTLQMAPPTRDSVVRTWLLARYAQQMGMVVSNNMINEFLKQVTRDHVSTANIQAALKRHGFSDYQFFPALIDDLAAKQLEVMFEVSLAGMPPAERWQYFTRVKQMATIEAVPVAVANYADRIADPTDEDLKGFFEKHKDQYPRPDSPTPGFHEPQRVALEYLKADFDKFSSPEAVSDEEVRERYEKNKEAYDQFEKKSAAEKPPEEKPAEQPAAAEKPADEGTPKPADEKAKEQPAPESKEPKKAGESQQQEKKEQPAKQSKDTSSVERPAQLMLTAFSEDKAAPKDEKTAEKPQPAAKEAEPANEPPATKEEKTDEKAAPTPSAKMPAEPKAGLTDAIKKQIRQEIAAERISEHL